MPALTAVERLQPIHGPDWHKATMMDFQSAKAALGEPSPHMTVVNHLNHDLPLDERLWRIGCYLVPYSLITAEALWNHLDLAAARTVALPQFVDEHWVGFHTRTERRMVRTIEKFTRSIESWVEFVDSGVPQKLLESRATYEDWWDAVNRVDFFGRYIVIRAIEAIRRDAKLHGDEHPEMELRDIRSIGGDSPVRALTMFTPDWFHPIILTDPAGADEAAELLLEELQAAGSPMDHYIFAAMLCEYREAYEDGHQYPGRTIDQELEYLSKPHAAYWESRPKPFAFQLRAARRDLFPMEALGEHQGWQGVRPELSHLLRDYGQVWSDLRYDYAKSIPSTGLLVAR